MALGMTKHEVASGQDMDSTADVLTYSPPKPMTVTRFGLVNVTAADITTALDLAIDKRPTAGSDSGRTEIQVLEPDAAVSQGEVVYMNLAERLDVNPGEEVVLEVKAASGNAPDADVWIEYDEYAFDPAGDNVTEVT